MDPYINYTPPTPQQAALRIADAQRELEGIERSQGERQ